MRNGLAVLSELGKVYSCLLMTACSNEALSALGQKSAVTPPRRCMSHMGREQIFAKSESCRLRQVLSERQVSSALRPHSEREANGSSGRPRDIRPSHLCCKQIQNCTNTSPVRVDHNHIENQRSFVLIQNPHI